MATEPDALPLGPYDRVIIAGLTGSGKTTLARRLAEVWGLTHVEIDALYHGPNWVPRPEFLDDVTRFAKTERWVTEWQYTSKGAGDIYEPRAQLAVWLDYPWKVARRRLVRRTLSRSLLRTELWNGNREGSLLRLVSPDPEKNILAWQRKTRNNWRERMPAALERNPHLTLARLTSPAQTDSWVAGLRRRPPTSPR
ncbi:adenylate kinase family enzyme [Leucobacter komagatae]|uniref:Adenylate kinase family enzyme n=1 Tax=Leucobacter komagatae TaxID=55969 RepID=A0A542Y490_9MICO|nr:AAA family ATPase [Leucobacter komagatae]TQL42881.1 adenylate kinase family enzyme [Leucobacter komagatae]